MKRLENGKIRIFLGLAVAVCALAVTSAASAEDYWNAGKPCWSDGCLDIGSLFGVRDQASSKASPFDYSLRPVCQVRNPPFEPHIVGGQYVHGEISQRCQGPVWKMGNYACIEAKQLGKKFWRLVWCEANEVFFSQGLNLNVEDYVLPAKKLWVWKLVGYVWVDYEPGNPTAKYRYEVNSPLLVTHFHPDQREGGRK